MSPEKFYQVAQLYSGHGRVPPLPWRIPNRRLYRLHAAIIAHGGAQALDRTYQYIHGARRLAFAKGFSLLRYTELGRVNGRQVISEAIKHRHCNRLQIMALARVLREKDY